MHIEIKKLCEYHFVPSYIRFSKNAYYFMDHDGETILIEPPKGWELRKKNTIYSNDFGNTVVVHTESLYLKYSKEDRRLGKFEMIKPKDYYP